MSATAFAAELIEHGAQVVSELREHKRAAMLDAFRGFVLGNPVGNPDLWKSAPPKGYVGGFSRGNWQMTDGAPAESTLALRPAAAAIAEAESAPVSLENTGWISNPTEYLPSLEFAGYSSQAPDGWIRAHLERVRARYE